MDAALAVFDFDKTLSTIETERRHVGAGKSADVIVDTVFGGAARAAGVKALVAELRREGAVVQVCIVIQGCCLTDDAWYGADGGVMSLYFFVLFGGVLFLLA